MKKNFLMRSQLFIYSSDIKQIHKYFFHNPEMNLLVNFISICHRWPLKPSILILSRDRLKSCTLKPNIPKSIKKKSSHEKVNQVLHFF